MPVRFLIFPHPFPSFPSSIPVPCSETPRSLFGHPSAPTALEMALLKRQAVNYEIFDDQSSIMWNSYVGNWTHYPANGFNNDTVTATPNPGASVSFSFSGTRIVYAWPCSVVLILWRKQGPRRGFMVAYWVLVAIVVDKSSPIQPPITRSTVPLVSHPPVALLDKALTWPHITAGSQKPWFDSSGAVVYFATPKLADGTHKIDITVSTANATDQFILDFFLISPIAGGSTSGVETSRSAPSPTSTSSSLPIVTASATPVGPIVGGVVGGIAGIAVLAFALWYFMKKRSSGGQAYYFDRPSPADILASEGLYTFLRLCCREH